MVGLFESTDLRFRFKFLVFTSFLSLTKYNLTIKRKVMFTRKRILKAIKKFETDHEIDMQVLGTYDELADKVQRYMDSGWKIDDAVEEIQMVSLLEAIRAENAEFNVVKETARALGMTQKQLSAKMGVTEDTVSNWSRGKIGTPKWALEMFKLLKKEKQFDTIKRIISDELD